MGLLNAAGRGIGKLGSGLRNNMRWHGAGSNAVIGSLMGAGMAAGGGGDMGDIGRAAAMGGIGGGLGATAGVPMLSSMAGPIAGMMAGVGNVMNPEAQGRRDQAEAERVLQAAQSMSATLDEKAIYTAASQLLGNRPQEDQQRIYDMALQMASGQ